jgi:cytochrome c556
MKKKTIAFAFGVVAIVAAGYFAVRSFTPSASAADMQAAIDARRTLMKDNGAKMKAMDAVIEAKTGDMAAMQQLALGLQANAAKIADLFPAGSSMTDFPDKTFAKSDIWVNFDGFKTAAAVLGTEAGKLADAAKSGDMAAFAAQFDATGEKGCGGCHTKFRQKKS